MKRPTLFVIVIFTITLILQSCAKDESIKSISTCNVSNVATDITWIAEWIETLNNKDNSDRDYDSILISKYKNETVLSYASCHPAVTYIPTFFDCNQNKVGTHPLDEDVTDSVILWKTKDNKCYD